MSEVLATDAKVSAHEAIVHLQRELRTALAIPTKALQRWLRRSDELLVAADAYLEACQVNNAEVTDIAKLLDSMVIDVNTLLMPPANLKELAASVRLSPLTQHTIVRPTMAPSLQAPVSRLVPMPMMVRRLACSAPTSKRPKLHIEMD